MIKKSYGLSILAIGIVISLVACEFQPTVAFDSAKSGDITLPFLSKREISTMLRRTDKSNLPKDVMAEMPDYEPDGSGPWNPGRVKQEALQLALDRLNLLRRLSGLPPVVMTDAHNEAAQYGAALMGITQSYGHGDQPKVPGISDEDHKKGTSATASGSIYPINNLVDAIDGYNRDPGNPTVGHRLWQLNPGQEAVGIGFVPPIEKKTGAMCEKVSGTPAPEGQKPRSFDWDFVSWPSAGYFPLVGSLFGTPATWSVQLNPNKYVASNAVKITLTRLNDNKTWNFNWQTGFLGGPTTVFRILDGGKDHPYQDGERYQVELKGLKDKAGNPVEFSFITEFFTP